MTIIRIIPLFFVVLFTLANFSRAQTITQDEFLDRLKQTHPLFEKEKLTAQIAREDRNSYLGNQDWNVLSFLNYMHEKPAIVSMGAERTDAVSVSGGVERLFWKTGGRLSTSLSFSRIDLKVNPIYGIPDGYFQNQFDITYVHPLMQNKGGFLDQLQYNLKQFDIDLSDVIAAENQEDFLVGYASKFLDLVLLLEQKKIVQQRLNLSEELFANTKKKREANLIDEVDVIRAEDAVHNARQNLLLVETQFEALQAELAIVVQDSNYYNLTPEFGLYETKILPSLDESVMWLRKDSRLVNALSIQLDQLAYTRRGFEETGKPNLSFVVQTSLKNAEENFGSSLVMDKPDALVGLQLDFPIGNTTAKSRIARTDLQIMQLEKQVDELILSLTSVLTNLHVQITELEQVLRLNQKQILSSQKKTKEELKLYNQGRGQLTFVIQSRDSEQTARLNYAGNSLTYHKLLLQYQALMDQLL